MKVTGTGEFEKLEPSRRHPLEWARRYPGAFIIL
jgi:hypothetical protein